MCFWLLQLSVSNWATHVLTDVGLSAASASGLVTSPLRLNCRVMEVTPYSRLLKLANVGLTAIREGEPDHRTSAQAGKPIRSSAAFADPENSCSFEVLSEKWEGRGNSDNAGMSSKEKYRRVDYVDRLEELLLCLWSWSTPIFILMLYLDFFVHRVHMFLYFQASWNKIKIKQTNKAGSLARNKMSAGLRD